MRDDKRLDALKAARHRGIALLEPRRELPHPGENLLVGGLLLVGRGFGFPRRGLALPGEPLEFGGAGAIGPGRLMSPRPPAAFAPVCIALACVMAAPMPCVMAVPANAANRPHDDRDPLHRFRGLRDHRRR